MTERFKSMDWAKWLPVIFTGLFIVAGLMREEFAAATPTATSLVELRSDIATLTPEVKDLRTRIDMLPGPGEMADLSRRIGGLEADVHQLQATSGQLTAQLTGLQQQVSDMTALSKMSLRH